MITKSEKLCLRIMWPSRTNNTSEIFSFSCSASHFILIFTLELGACLLFKEKWAFQKASRVKNWSQLMQSFILKTFFLSRPLEVNCLHLTRIPENRPLVSNDLSSFRLYPNFHLWNKNPSKWCGIKWKMTGLDQIFTFLLKCL